MAEEVRLMSDAHKVELTDGVQTALHSHPGGGNGGPTEKGIATTDGQGVATVNFVGSYASKPVVSLTPDLPHDTEVVVVQIDGWVGPPYTGLFIYSAGDDGKTEANVPVHWLIWT